MPRKSKDPLKNARIHELELLDKIEKILLEKVQKGNERAAETLLKVQTRRAKLLGLDSPKASARTEATIDLAGFRRALAEAANESGAIDAGDPGGSLQPGKLEAGPAPEAAIELPARSGEGSDPAVAGQHASAARQDAPGGEVLQFLPPPGSSGSQDPVPGQVGVGGGGGRGGGERRGGRVRASVRPVDPPDEGVGQ